MPQIEIPDPKVVATRTGRTIGSLITAFIRLLGGLAARGYVFAENWLLDSKKARYGLAVTRIFIGVTGMGLLAANWSTRFYSFTGGAAWTGELQEPSSDFPKIGVFGLFRLVQSNDTLFTLAYIGLFFLALLVMLGWRTKFVLPVFLVTWVGFIELNDLLSDQGDNMYRMMMIYLLFADTSARLSLDARRHRKRLAAEGKPTGFIAGTQPYTNLFNNLAIVVLALHVSFVYMSGALYKAQGQTWANGYAIFNPLHVERFSTWPELADLITSFGPLAVAISWGTIIVQMTFLPMLMNRITRIFSLLVIFSFHMGIAFFMGLPFFSLAMIAIDAIFIRDHTWLAFGNAIRGAWRKTAGASSTPEAPTNSAEKPIAAPASPDEPQAVEEAAPIDIDVPEPQRERELVPSGADGTAAAGATSKGATPKSQPKAAAPKAATSKATAPKATAPKSTAPKSQPKAAAPKGQPKSESSARGNRTSGSTNGSAPKAPSASKRPSATSRPSKSTQPARVAGSGARQTKNADGATPQRDTVGQAKR